MNTAMTTRNIYTIEEVARHNTEDDCWIILGNETNGNFLVLFLFSLVHFHCYLNCLGGKKVYNVTQFLSEHPGGRDIILDFAGKDADSMFEDIGHSTTAKKMLNAYLIGILQVFLTSCCFEEFHVPV
jgi:cytochrome b involved in lipid metabolism